MSLLSGKITLPRPDKDNHVKKHALVMFHIVWLVSMLYISFYLEATLLLVLQKVPYLAILISSHVTADPSNI